MSAPGITVEYIRPGKETSYYEEDLLLESDEFIKTSKHVPAEIAEKLSHSLRQNGFIANDQRCEYVTKVYFFHEYFNLLQFQDENQRTLGYYSDIGTPLTRTPSGFQMTDWFLDIWLSPSGQLFELDIDEFEEALAKGLMNDAEAQIARSTFARLVEEVRQGIYPAAYLK